jgi:hypothetical protein
MKRTVLKILMIYILGIGACAGLNAMTLEFKDVQSFSLSEDRNDGLLSLRISGLAFHSALAVERVETITKDDTIVVKVLLVPARSGLSGRFDHTVSVPSKIQRVVFGENGYQIWPKR